MTMKSKGQLMPMVSAAVSDFLERCQTHPLAKMLDWFNDRCNEPPCGHNWGNFVDCGWPHSKVGAIISTIPIEVWGRHDCDVWHGQRAGVSLLSGVNWNRRNLMILQFHYQLALACNSNQAPCGICLAR